MILSSPISEFSWAEPFAIVPDSLYEEENKYLWLNFLREKTPIKQDVAREDIPSQGCIFLYERDSAEEEQTNRAHIIPYTIRYAEAHASRTHALGVVVNEDKTAIALLSNGKLQLANIYQTEVPTDVLYYILKVLEMHNVGPNDCTCFLHADIDTRTLINEYLPCE